MVISVHVPKTAGSTFRRVLTAVYRDDVFFDYGDQYRFVDIYEPTLLMKGIRFVKSFRFRRGLNASTRCIHGHFQATKYRARFPDAPLITWLRDPVERVASHYYHWLRNPDRAHTLSGRLRANRMTLTEFASIPEMRDLQARYLDGVPLKSFAFVGVQERFRQSLAGFCDFAHVEPISVAAHNTNAAKGVENRYSLTVGERDHIAAMNQHDLRLYDEALRRSASDDR